MNDVDSAIKKVDKNESSAVELTKTLLKDGKERVVVELRRANIMPERMESPARNHTFHDVAGFKAFLKANKSAGTLIFADVDGVIISAILDDKAKTGFEEVQLKPPYHPEYKLLRDSLLNQTLSIENFARGVMRNRKVIKDTNQQDAKSIAMAMQQLTVATAIVQAIGDGKISVNGVMTTTSVTSGSPEANEHLDLPDSLQVELPIYLNTPAVKFAIDITISTKQGQVITITDAPELEVRKYEVFQMMMVELSELEDVTIVYGQPNAVNWQYNR